MSKAPLSICIIFRDDPLLEKAVASVRPYVEQICVIVDTDAPGVSRERLANLGVTWQARPWRDDFAWTRNECLAIATQPWVGWLDSDDEVVGADHFAREIARIKPGGRLLAPYEYGHETTASGDRVVTVQQWRERIVANDGSWHWEHPTHETLVKKPGTTPYDPGLDVWMEGVRWVHQRTETGARPRSLAILKAWYAAGHDDAWTHLNLGIELHAAGEYGPAATHYADHFRLSGWPEERVLSALRAADCATAIDIHGKNRYAGAAAWIDAAHEILPNAFEPHFAMAKLAMIRATVLGESSAYREVLVNCARAIVTPESRSPVGRDLQDRAFRVHDLMRTAAEVEEEWATALEAAERALAARPGDPYLTLARKRYAAAKLVASFVPFAPKSKPFDEQKSDNPASSGGLVFDAGSYIRELQIQKFLRQQDFDVVFLCGPAYEPWNPELVARYGAGGSETAVVEVAKRLAGFGHKVRVYGAPGQEGTFEGVDYLTWTPEIRPDCDVLVAWRMASFLAQANAKVRLMWCHDVSAIGMTYELSLLAERFFALSKWHAGNLVRAHGIPESQVVVTRNGIDPVLFEGAMKLRVARNPKRAVYTSSPDRGLGLLLDLWPEIRDRVPGATLDVCYGFANWERDAAGRKDQQHRFLCATLKERMRVLPGVTYRGRANKRELVDLLCVSGAWLYPTWFDETSCIAAMEARAAGLRIVTSDRGALPETVGPYGELIDGDWLGEDYRGKFVTAAVDALCEDRQTSAMTNSWLRSGGTRDALRDLDWAGVAEQWDVLFAQLVDEQRYGAIPAYREHREVT